MNQKPHELIGLIRHFPKIRIKMTHFISPQLQRFLGSLADYKWSPAKGTAKTLRTTLNTKTGRSIIGIK